MRSVTSGCGEAATIANGDGYDLTLVQRSELPYGLSLNNDAAAESTAMINLDGGADRLEIRDGVTLPPRLLGTVQLDGGLGADFYHLDAGIPFTNFEFFLP